MKEREDQALQGSSRCCSICCSSQEEQQQHHCGEQTTTMYSTTSYPLSSSNRGRRGRRRRRGGLSSSLLLPLLLPVVMMVMTVAPSLILLARTAGAFIPPLPQQCRPPRHASPSPSLSRLGLYPLPPAPYKQQQHRPPGFDRRPLPPPPPYPGGLDGAAAATDSSSSSSSSSCGGASPPPPLVSFPLPLGYQLGMLSPDDLGIVTRLLLACFPVPLPDIALAQEQRKRDAVSGAKGGVARPPSLLERAVLFPYGSLVAWASLLLAKVQIRSGLVSRTGERLWRPSWDCPSLDSLMLVVQEEATNRIVAVVELSLSQPDGNLLPSYRRGPKRMWQVTHRPYLCNLAVLPSYRGQGLGRALVRHCESISRDVWGYECLYLHLDASDPAASHLYASMGYTKVDGLKPTGWLQALMQQAISKDGSPLQYHIKHLTTANRPVAPTLQEEEEEEEEDGDLWGFAATTNAPTPAAAVAEAPPPLHHHHHQQQQHHHPSPATGTSAVTGGGGAAQQQQQPSAS